jgi:hypothetical protein
MPVSPSRERVVSPGDRTRTQNGHIRNDTHDVSWRWPPPEIGRICRRSRVGDDRAGPHVTLGDFMVKRGSTVRVRRRALQKRCTSAVLRMCSVRFEASESVNGALYGAFASRTLRSRGRKRFTHRTSARQPQVDKTTSGCHTERMNENGIPAKHADTVLRIKEVRAKAIEHTRIARQFAAERRELMQALLRDGVSQAQIARELGVTRQAIQKMLAC